MAGPATTTNGQIIPAAKKKDHVIALIDKLAPSMAAALPKHVRADRMARVALTALRRTPQLLQCSEASLLASIMTLAQLGLEPNTPLGHAYLIPYGNECTPIIGYQGFIDIARRSGLVTSIYAHVVREGDTFKYTLGLRPTIDHVPSDLPDREDKPITHVYAVAHLRDGDPIFVVLSNAQVEARRKRGASGRGKKTPWDTDREAMTLKTAVRALWRWLPKSAEMQRAQETDESSAGAALDDAGRSALAAVGVVPPEAADFDTTGETVDQETGEVTPAAEKSPLESTPD
jgi:recombination protein RecT